MNIKRLLKISAIGFIIGYFLFPTKSNKNKEKSNSVLVNKFNIQDQEIKQKVLSFENKLKELECYHEFLDFEENHRLRTIKGDLNKLLLIYFELGKEKQKERKETLVDSIDKMIKYLEKIKVK